MPDITNQPNTIADTGASIEIPVPILPSLEPAMERALRHRLYVGEAELAAKAWLHDWHLEQADAAAREYIEEHRQLATMRHVLLMRGRAE